MKVKLASLNVSAAAAAAAYEAIRQRDFSAF
jgi:tRNA(Leu) C34 or U34 (ribose-2'-O)-methylase TrmL